MNNKAKNNNNLCRDLLRRTLGLKRCRQKMNRQQLTELLELNLGVVGEEYHPVRGPGLLGQQALPEGVHGCNINKLVYWLTIYIHTRYSYALVRARVRALELKSKM